MPPPFPSPYPCLTCVQHFGGYGETNPPTFFQDFYWAAFFKTRLAPPPANPTPEDMQLCKLDQQNEECIGDIHYQLIWLNRVLPEALAAAKSDAARSLPGYGLGCGVLGEQCRASRSLTAARAQSERRAKLQVEDLRATSPTIFAFEF